ncbi:sugar ABC transporter ATP-binding protein [Vitiosangium sp. GDMCC 1.1324]|uniref:sugar ABC transporter ATP-binding protein n=1 Tax=Vitiosangium sp. (strain GDMCC 1.1324) TaxID=2138576 RepID=UPI000D3462D8|nr:sugar ABC transporter ATP-binding protein [Vitiosangium sp. GDMCC 1.1324]PTL85737.1 sugar ABC transporter ATP-binding protein [Vitiosangium sp. GDMCC 1.1324]
MSTEPVLIARGIEKRFPGVHALCGVDLEVRAGEVHALMGQNGAGKSTLIKILTGVYSRDGGTLSLEGRDFRPTSPGDAQRKGISTIYQEVNLVPTLSVAENLFLGRAPRRWFGIDWRAMRRKAEELLASFDLQVNVEQPVGSLSAAIQQLIAIARAVQTDARVIIMDEPTSSLDRHETELLLDIIGRLKARGIGIVFVSHFLDQVYKVSDRITVLRNGTLVGTFDASQLSRLELVTLMLGKLPEEVSLPPRTEDKLSAVVSARDLSRKGVEPFDLTLHEGEVVGFAGLLGSGRTEAARLLFGADRARSGTVNGAIPTSPRQAIEQGVAFCPEDRKAEGIIPDLSVRENIALVVQRKLGFTISRAQQERLAQELVTKLGIKTPSVEQPVRLLSGGNQQKVILARWLAYDPRVLILDEPTRGIDVGAKTEIERLIHELSQRGLAVLFISAALEEVLRLSHRIAVFRDRKKVGELSSATLPEVMKLIAGEEHHAP